MSRRDDESLPEVPPLVPDRDEVLSRQRRGNGPPATPPPRGPTPPPGRGGGGGGGWAVPALLGLLIVALAGFGAWQQLQLEGARDTLDAYEMRVAELERRLSHTDESVSQSSVAMQVKLQELDSEIRKLWDNVWRRARAQLEEHEGKIGKLESDLGSTRSGLSDAQKTLAESRKSLDSLRQQVDRFSRLDSSVELTRRKVEEQQAALEAAIDRVDRAVADMGRLERRVGANEEWVQSINNFRQQMNRELLTLKEQISRGG